jgi:hypothetical protein
MTSEEKLRELVRKIIQEELQGLEEISTSAGAGAYLTPMAFRGNKQKNVAKMRNVATQMGYTLSKRGEKELTRPADKMENLAEAKMKYHEYKNDTKMTPHQKIAKAISEVNKNLAEMERVIKMNSRLQSETGISSEALWKRTQNSLIKLEARLVSMAGKVREIRGK